VTGFALINLYMKLMTIKVSEKYKIAKNIFGSTCPPFQSYRLRRSFVAAKVA